MQQPPHLRDFLKLYFNKVKEPKSDLQSRLKTSKMLKTVMNVHKKRLVFYVAGTVLLNFLKYLKIHNITSLSRWVSRWGGNLLLIEIQMPGTFDGATPNSRRTISTN